MTLIPIPARLSSLKDARKTTNNLINRLSRLHDTANSSDARVELSAEIHQLLREQEEELELLLQEVEDITVGRDREREAEKARLEVSVQRLVEDLRLARVNFRKAQLQAKRNEELARQREREALFASTQKGKEQQTAIGAGRRRGQEHSRELTKEELEVNASSDVTAALRRTHQLMQSELSRSQFAHDTLQQSTEALNSLTESYTDLGSLLSTSRSLVSTLLRSRKTDTWYLETAFYILAGTIVWLIFRRLLYGPLWWLVWLPLKLSFKSLSAVFSSLTFLWAGKGGESASSNTPSLYSTSLIIQPSATGAFPRWNMGDGSGSVPSVVVGGGRKEPPEAAGPQATRSSLVQQVGKMVDDSRAAAEGKPADTEQAERDQRGDQAARPEAAPEEEPQRGEAQHVEEVRPNPKKRMWEEDKEARKYEQMNKDEL